MDKYLCCNFKDKFVIIKNWRFRFHDDKMLEYPKCKSISNYYADVRARNKALEFIVKIKPKG
jgi:hypothetical protein